jgi:hypothetical protein
VVHHVLELLDLSLTRLKLLFPLHQLGFEVVDVALGNSHIILGVLQLGVGVVERVGLEVEVAVHMQQVIVKLLVAPLEGVGPLK